MRTIAIMPIKLDNERLPGKNTKLLNGKPLLCYELDNLLETKLLDDIYVYCSSEDVCPYLPKGVKFAKRPEYLDLPTSNFTQIFGKFVEEYDADIYVYAHATAPYIKRETMEECIRMVREGKYDSAFCASKIQDYLWQEGRPLNFDAENVPRSQDMVPIYRETSGVYVLKKEVFIKTHRRIGENPYIKEVGFKEAIDINYPEDFKLAEIFADIEISC